MCSSKSIELNWIEISVVIFFFRLDNYAPMVYTNVASKIDFNIACIRIDWYGRALKSNQTNVVITFQFFPKNIWLWHSIYLIQIGFDSASIPILYIVWCVSNSKPRKPIHTRCIIASVCRIFILRLRFQNGYLLKSINYFARENN